MVPMNPENQSPLATEDAPAPGIEEVPVDAEVTADGQVVFTPRTKSPREILSSPPVMCPPPIPAKDNEVYLHAVKVEGHGAWQPAIYVPPHKVRLGDPSDAWKQIELLPGQTVTFDQRAQDVPKVIGITMLDGYWLIHKQKMVYADPRAACLTRLGKVLDVSFWCPFLDAIPNSPHHEQHGAYVGYVETEVNGKPALKAQEPDRNQQELVGPDARPGVCLKCLPNPKKRIQADEKVRQLLLENRYAQNQG